MSQKDSIPVFGNATYTWNIKLYEKLGFLCVDWSSNAPFSPQDANIAIYIAPLSEPYPRGADKGYISIAGQLSGTWETGLPWGSGYYAAINATLSTDNYRYIVTAGPTVA